MQLRDYLKCVLYLASVTDVLGVPVDTFHLGEIFVNSSITRAVHKVLLLREHTIEVLAHTISSLQIRCCAQGLESGGA